MKFQYSESFAERIRGSLTYIYANLAEIENFAYGLGVSQFQTREKARLYIKKYSRNLFRAHQQILKSCRRQGLTPQQRQDFADLASRWNIKKGKADVRAYLESLTTSRKDQS